MQCACIILPYVACPALQYFSTLSHKRHDFRKIVTEYKTCFFIFFQKLLPKAFVILRRNERDMIKYVLVFMLITRYSCPILIKLWFSRQIFEKSSKNNTSRNSLQWEPSCFMRTDRRTDERMEGQRNRLDETNIRFSQFC
jgi:hypothetical protein